MSKLKTKDQLKRAHEELEQFFYIASHDLQEPARTLLGLTQLLEDHLKDHEDEKVQEYLELIKAMANHMNRLVMELLHYSRIGREEEAEHIDLKSLVNQVLDRLDSRIQEKGAEVAVTDNPEILVYPKEFRLLIEHLISNSLTYSRPETPPRLIISAEKQNDGWQITFEDNGIGFEEKYKDEVFKVFKRLHSRKQYDGTGIGLAHCKKVIERIGGSIWCESKPGEGSKFYLYLPERI